MVSTLVADPLRCGSIPSDGLRWRNLCDWTRVQKLMSPASNWCTGRFKLSFIYQIPTWSVDLIFCAAHMHCLPFTSHDHGSGSGILRVFSASGKWGCFGVPKTTPIKYAKRRRASRLFWLSTRLIPKQHQPAGSILQRQLLVNYPGFFRFFLLFLSIWSSGHLASVLLTAFLL